MWRILKQMDFYIGVVFFGFILALGMPSMVKCTGPRITKEQPHKTILKVVRHPDTTFSVFIHDQVYDALYEDELDSIMNTLKY
jgi:hypothetical protein